MKSGYEAHRMAMQQDGPDWCEHGMDASCPVCRLESTQADLATVEEEYAAFMQKALTLISRFYDEVYYTGVRPDAGRLCDEAKTFMVENQ